jgi:hypothetical protein
MKNIELDTEVAWDLILFLRFINLNLEVNDFPKRTNNINSLVLESFRAIFSHVKMSHENFQESFAYV